MNIPNQEGSMVVEEKECVFENNGLDVQENMLNVSAELVTVAQCDESIEKHDNQKSKRWSPSKSVLKDYLHFCGPGWLVAVAYLDPGNTQADIQVGVGGGYNQLWSVFYNTLISIYVQILCARLALKAQATLSEVQREQMPKLLVYINWLIAEFSVIITDIPEVIGIGIALNVFFGCPYYVGVLISPVTTFLFLGTQELKFGMRIMETIVAILLGIMGLVLWIEMGKYSPNAKQWIEGTIYGFAKTDGFDLFTLIGVMGAVVMPHNLYLHTASVLSRPVVRKRKVIKKAMFWASIEPVLPIVISYFMNVALVTVAAKAIYFGTSDAECDDACRNNLGNTDFADYLNINGSKILWGLALLAAGQSSAITTTYAGQYIMDGFLKMKLPVWQRAIGTRAVALLPCVIVASVAQGSALNVIVNIVNATLGFLLPFALIPLIKYSTSEAYLGKENLPSLPERVCAWIIGFVVYGINAYQLSANGGGFFGELMQGSEQTVTLQSGETISFTTQTASSVQLNIINDVVQVIYFVWIAYVIYMPIKKPMRPLESTRYVEEEGCFGVVNLLDETSSNNSVSSVENIK